MSKALSDYSREELLDVIKGLKKRKKFGLVWEENPENIAVLCDTNLPVLREDAELALKHLKDSPSNFLIEGDNYHSLSVLNFTHAGLIDFIYCDPPYNTGNKDFIYNDEFVDEEDAYRHSKWLSFMRKRLDLAKSLLTEDGVIFVSIGTHEHHRLRMLMDEIFDERNFLGSITRVQKAGSDMGTHFAPSIDYVLAYAKQKALVSGFREEVTEEYKASFKKTDHTGLPYKEKGLYQSSLDARPNQRYYIECPDGSFCIPPGATFPEVAGDGEQVTPKTGKGQDKVWRWSRDSYLRERENLVFKKTKSSPLLDEHGNPSPWNVYTKQYLEEGKATLPRDFLNGYDNSQGTLALKELGLSFSFAKPVGLIEHLLAIVDKPNALVLDFFAGSGTTGQAVLQRNLVDGGNRRFILCTNNENDIAIEITYERIKRITAGYQSFKAIPANLRYLRTELVSKQTTDDQTRAVLVSRSADVIKLREDTFDVLIESSSHSIYQGVSRVAAVIYEPEEIPQIIDELNAMNSDLPLSIYVFSMSNDTYDEDFSQLNRPYELRAIPEVMLAVYRRIFAEEQLRRAGER